MTETSSFQRLALNLEFHRWAIPLLISALGIGYTIWESVLVDGHPMTSEPAVMGFLLLGLVVPILAFGTLTWALEGAEYWERAQQASERERRHLIALNQIGESVNQSLELSAVLDRAVDRILEELHLSYGEVRLASNSHLELRASRGVSEAFLRDEQTISMGYCACGRCAARGELIAADDLQHLSEFANTACQREGFSSSVSVPVRTATRVIGVIHLASKEPRSFDAEERALLTSIGYLVGTAIEKAQLHTQLGLMNQELEARVLARTRELFRAKEELAQKARALSQVLTEERRVEEKTRANIANDLHDGVQQLIVGALYETQAARETANGAAPTIVSHIAAAQELLNQIAAEMRHAIYSLLPVALDSQGLAPAIRECVARFERVANVRCDLKIEGTPRRLAIEAESAAFRIVQEALNNVQAHARARHARIDVRFAQPNLRIDIRDDGIGFDLAAMKQRTCAHLGLIGMRERAESAGGVLEIESRVGQGTRIGLSVPDDRI